MRPTHLRNSIAAFTAAAGTAVLLAAPTPAHASTQTPAAVTSFSPASAAVAASAANPCKGKNYSTVAYTFWIGVSKMPLRCGTKTWGYNHIVARGRWSTSFKNKISATLFSGYEASPGVYYLYKVGAGCSPKPRKNFKVVVNKGPLGGMPGGLTPQGVITATEEYTTPAVAAASATAKANC